MPNPEWGVKRVCPSCGARYYDLMRSPIICPECEAPFEAAAKDKATDLKADLVRAQAAKESAKAKAPVEDEDELIDDGDAESDDTLLEDDDETEGDSGPALSDEETEDEPVEFEDTVLLDDDEDDETIEEIAPVPGSDEET